MPKLTVPLDYVWGQHTLFPGTPTRYGFIFDGWSPSLTEEITENTTFTAQWRTPVKTWVSNETPTATWNVELNLGVVAQCPTISSAQSQLEAANPAANQSVGDRGRVIATTEDNGAFLPCTERRFRVEEV